MMINNVNEKISQNRKRRIERKIEMDDKKKLILNKRKTEREKKNKIIDKIEQLENGMIKIKYADYPILSESKKTQVIDKNLRGGELEMVGSLLIGDKF